MGAQQLTESLMLENSTSYYKGKNLVVGGRFSKSDVKNGNGRIYKNSMWKRILNRPDIKACIAERRMVGELGHPDIIETTPVNISHIVTKLELQPNGEVYGEAEILDTPSGQILKTLYEAGVKMGISSRGYLPEGSNLFPEGDALVVPDDYELVTFDFVLDPSSQGACPSIKESQKAQLKSIISESKDKVNSDVISYIEGLQNSDIKSQDSSEKFRILKESLKEEVENKKEVRTLKAPKSNENVESIIKDLRDRYLTAEDIISDLVEERKTSNEVLQGLTKRYLTAEQVIKEFRDYSLKLEETVADLVKLQHTSESVIADLRDRYTLSEKVIAELRDKYLVSEEVISELRDRYTLSENKVKELEQTVTSNKESETQVKESTSREISALSERCDVYEQTIDELTAQLKESQKKHEKKRVPENYFEDISIKYGLSIQEAKRIFKELGCKKNSFEFHLEERKKMANGRYSEFPYMVDGSTSKNVYEILDEQVDTESTRIARLVEKSL